MKIKNLYIEKEILEDIRTIEISKKLKFENKIICNSFQEIFNIKNQNFRIQKKEPSIILAKKKKKIFTRCTQRI